MNLEKLGWNDFFNTQFNNHIYKNGMQPGRVSREHKGFYNIITEDGECLAEISGRMRYTAEDSGVFPAVGDWVMASVYADEGKAVIHDLLERKNHLSRKAVLSGGMPDTWGKTREQVLAANIDTVFLVNGLDSDFSVRRIERYMTTVYDSGMEPVIVLNKTDLAENLDEYISRAESIAFGAPVIPVSGLNNAGMESLKKFIRPGSSIIFLGSSGVGKSTIINRLIGTERQKVNEVREYDHKGRHTTTGRELMVLPEGGILIDTPGMREFQPWKSEEETARYFEDIETFAAECRFKDCTHNTEPGCAVIKAIEEGLIDRGRYDNYTRMKKEARYLEIRMEGSAQHAEKKRWKSLSKLQKEYKKKM